MGRRFGQHFLTKRSILDRIAAAACNPALPEKPTVIEIGPGRGALTEALLPLAQKVIAIEVDPVLVHYLRQKFHNAIAGGCLEIIEGDVLKTDLSALASRPVIAGNLPYYITSPILEKVFELGANWSNAVFLVQAEVAARITAEPGHDFGYLSVLCQIHAQCEQLFGVSREAFRPPPKVESAVVRLTPRDPSLPDVPAFLQFAQACFQHKRKTLRNNLEPVYGKEKLEAAHLPAKIRAEQMGLEGLVTLYKKLSGEETTS